MVVGLVGGFLLDWRGFVGNLIAGVLEIIITVTIINYLLQKQHRARWQGVRSQIANGLAQHIDNLMSEYQTSFYSSELDLLSVGMRAGPYGLPNPQTLETLCSIVEAMEKAPRPKNSEEELRKLRSAINWDIEQIVNTLMPRVLAIEYDEPELVSLLGGFDGIVRQWSNEIKIDEAIALGCDQYSTAIKTLKAAAEIYAYLVSHRTT